MSRRIGRRLLPAVVALLVAAGLAWWLSGPTIATRTAETGQTPVVLYLIDTLRADRLSVYGYDKPTSPRMEALAKESVVFERAYAPAPWTLPSLASLVTSLPVCEHGIINRRLRLNLAVKTLAERLADLGYATGAYYQNGFAGLMSGLDRGYQISQLRLKHGALESDAREFLARVGTQPFLLYLHSMEPHQAYDAPGEFIRRFGHVGVDDRQVYKDDWMAYRMAWNADVMADRPVGTTDASAEIESVSERLRRMKPEISLLYDAAVAYADEELGQTVDVLKASGVWDRALVIVLADHGEEIDEHGGWFHDQSVYEELIHVPLLIHFPGGEFGGRRVTERVSLLDVMPTVLDTLGQRATCDGCRGSSLLPLLRPENGRDYRELAAPALRQNDFGYYKVLKKKRGDVNLVLRDGDLKAIWNREPGTVELYDLATDGGERNDLASVRAAEASDTAARAARWLAECEGRRREPTTVLESTAEVEAQTRERLRAMGYFN